jgi:hypothetical protein
VTNKKIDGVLARKKEIRMQSIALPVIRLI